MAASPGVTLRRSPRLWVVPVVFVLFVWTMTTHGKYSDSGDEPHYLLVAESLLSDHDLDLANNYANGDARWFGADDLAPGLHARRARSGALVSSHDVGLPLLILPVYAAATRLAAHAPEDWLARVHQTRGLFAYSLISLAMTTATACAIWLLLRGVIRVAPRGAAMLVVGAMAFSPPVLSHAFLVFPETPALWATCAALWLVCLRETELTFRRVLAVVAAVAVLPWLHRKYSFYVLGLVWLVAWRHRAWLMRQPRARVIALGAVAVLPVVGLYLWTLDVWGNLAGPHMLGGSLFALDVVPRATLGLLFDRERGLFSAAPLFLVAPACWALSWRDSRPLAVPLLSLFAPLSAFVVWNAGFSPAARFLVPLAPLIALPIVQALANVVVRRTFTGLLVFQGAVTAYIWQHPRTLWPKELGTNQVLDAIPFIGPAYSRLLPSLLTGDPIWWGLLCAGGLAILTGGLVYLAGRKP
ncbi:MAG: hypothetical protein ACHQO8_02430 [Vicinamibacterales bacterium]